MKYRIRDRGEVMEDLFFAQSDRQLLDALRKEFEKTAARKKLETETGIHDVETLDALLEKGVTPESLEAVRLIPLVAVAWADWVLEDAEKEAILKAAEAHGIHQGTPSYQLLETWLKHKPKPELLESWKAYVQALVQTLEPAALNQLKTNVLERAKGVAEAAGGFLGIGNKISESEEAVLEDLAKTFDPL